MTPIAKRRLFLAAAVIACTPTQAAPMCSVETRPFGTLVSGEPVLSYTIRNQRIGVEVLNYGGIIRAIHVPDREGKVKNVVRTLEKLSDYESNATFSKIVGRFAGRISGGGFSLDGRRHDLVTRPDGLSVHGGPGGFGSRLWKSSAVTCGVDLSLSSPDGENGFPGNLVVKAEFQVVDAELRISYTATTDKPTVVNLTHHAFFRLSDTPDIDGHVLRLNADQWLPTDGRRVPTGEIAAVSGALDLRTGSSLGKVINSDEKLIRDNNGLDHTFVLNGQPAATLSDPASGRVLEVLTSEPGIVVFSANSWNGTLRDDAGHPLLKSGGLALETQHFPNSPNLPAFPTTTVRPRVPLRSTTVYRFSVNPQ